MILDWKAIRPLNGSRAEGFQELCVQLARSESPVNAEFIPKGIPDAGVECFCVLKEGSEWGWQAKYFDTLGQSQWSQIDRSVKKALDKHPALQRYFVCVPMNRPDARIEGQKSALRRWNEHLQKWTAWAIERDMNVEFVWWGSSELLDFLSRPEHIGRVYFWFGILGFDQSWFQDRLKEAVDAAGPRYTPEIHVDLPIAQELDAFGRTVASFDRIKSLAREVRRELRSLSSPKAGDDDSHTQFHWEELCQAVRGVVKGFADLGFTPEGVIQYDCIVDKVAEAESKADEVQASLADLACEYQSRSPDNEEEPRYRQNPFRDWGYRIHQLQSTLHEVRSSLDQANTLANASLMVLKGEAGTGKTHLLCDLAQRRVDVGSPTILLMGQRFLGSDEPWSQALQHLDMRDATVEEFVGALEAAAQAANCRAVVMIDALNECRGLEIWPVHLSAFLARLEKSKWIGVVLAVRSTYEQFVIPQDVRDRAVDITHHGFIGEEYNATQSFFSYYELEFPSTPILQPEYRNPLFLKTICKGLWSKGERRLPRGFHGITTVFSLYLGAINEQLSKSLNYNEKDNLVQSALDSVARQIIEKETRWLPRKEVEEVVNERLPLREFTNSLYRGLIDEGVLVEIMDWTASDSTEEVVFIAYDRFADQIITDHLLRTHLDKSNPEAAFAEGGPLAFLYGEGKYDLLGLLEAMSIQVPEWTGRELLRIAPKVIDDPDIGLAFLQSIVWRRLDAFSEDTHVVLNAFFDNKTHLTETLDSLLTVSTIPGHPFNADRLDHALRRHTMPDRDTWWSIYLHQAVGSGGTVDRLLDWAGTLQPDHDLEEQVLDLSATSLAWMLTTPNRFLRDRATKALVSLLTDQHDSVVRLVVRFSDVDDLYVTERIYAVAYGVIMRSHDLEGAGKVASAVYENVFASGRPPAHIMLRDYALGVIERAVYLGSEVVIEEELIRPPYKSDWPRIPSECELDKLTPHRNQVDWKGGVLEWSRDRIRDSVMSDDFARYVIGTNSGSTNWLSLRLDEEVWQSPEERLQDLVLCLSNEEQSALEDLEEADNAVNKLEAKARILQLRDGYSTDDVIALQKKLPKAKQELNASRKRFNSATTAVHRKELDSILAANEDFQERVGPRFNLRVIQQYILWRVFDLGWSVDRFGEFDHFSIGYSGREARKAERMGKKYQWIAYHEILALMADHFQYREHFGGDTKVYEGTWQESIRDIDPSSTLSKTPGGTSWGPHIASWWGNAPYSDWAEDVGHRDWITRKDGLPRFEELQRIVQPEDDSRWLCVRGIFIWHQPHSAHVEPNETDRRELAIDFMGYFMSAQDADKFMDWAKDVDFWGRWMPEGPGTYGLYLGEFGWSPAFSYFNRPYYGGEDWFQPEGCPVAIRPAFFEYFAEHKGLDCSLDESYTLHLPHYEFVDSLGRN